jgi:cellulose synthase/poly-beta-1,6-N-acetylglucosamine synthase-like glycosyltransferase
VKTIVVADNCTDDTALKARASGAIVVERHDPRTGKGYALAAGLDHLPPDAEAVLFVDGDCTISDRTLELLNANLESGRDCVQLRYDMEITAQAASGLARRLALTLVHVVRPLAKARIGASAGLKGSGMCFERSLIDRLGWRTHGLAEDIEQHIALLQLGRRVHYEHDAVVTGITPSTLADAEGQHRRWESGRLAAASHAPGLARFALRNRSLAAADAAAELLTPPMSILAVLLLLTTAGGGLWGGTTAKGAILAAWIGAGCYLAAGIVRSAMTVQETIKMLVGLPSYAMWKVRVYARSVYSRPAEWEPTIRDEA